MRIKDPKRTLLNSKKALLLLSTLLIFLFSQNVFAYAEESAASVEEAAVYGEEEQTASAEETAAPDTGDESTDGSESFETIQISDIIAHAGGAIIGDGRVSIYTNSREAFELNYRLGFRTFEVDLELTSDGKLAAVHDWDDYGMKNGQPMSSKEWLAAGAMGKGESKPNYTSMLFENVLDLMKKYPDILIVTDTKYSDERASQMFKIITDTVEQTDPVLFDRLIPQIYTNEMYDALMELYPWKNIIYTTYNNELSADEIIDFCAEKFNIHVITCATHDKRFGVKETKKIHENGMLTYRHTIDNLYTMAKFSVKDIDGYYTNMILPEEMARVTAVKGSATGETGPEEEDEVEEEDEADPDA